MKAFIFSILLTCSMLGMAERPDDWDLPEPESCGASPQTSCTEHSSCSESCFVTALPYGSVNCYANEFVAYCTAYDHHGNITSQSEAGGSVCMFCCTMSC